jgi:hypothetical protein
MSFSFRVRTTQSYTSHVDTSRLFSFFQAHAKRVYVVYMKSNTPNETAAKISASQRARWAHVKELDHAAAALAFRYAATTPGSDRDVMALLAQRAFETAPPLTKRRWKIYRDALAGGRDVRVKSFPLELTKPPTRAELADAVDAAFDESFIQLLAEEEGS